MINDDLFVDERRRRNIKRTVASLAFMVAGFYFGIMILVKLNGG